MLLILHGVGALSKWIKLAIADMLYCVVTRTPILDSRRVRGILFDSRERTLIDTLDELSLHWHIRVLV